jgi:hypothetical protein
VGGLRDSTPPPDGDDRHVGVKALWLKVIIRAVFDWVSYRDSTKPALKKLAENAENWLFNTGRNEFNSLENICEVIDLSASKVREWARTMTKDQVAKIEHLERSVGLSGGLSLDTRMFLLNIANQYDNKEEDLLLEGI